MTRTGISLYPTHNLLQKLLEGSAERIHLHLDRPGGGRKSDRVTGVYLGQHALSWTTEDIVSWDFAENAYALSKAHIVRQRASILNRSRAYFEPVRWEANAPPSRGGFMVVGASIEENRSSLEKLVAPVVALLNDTTAKKHYSDLPAIIAFMQLILRRGVDPDPRGYLTAFAFCGAEGDGIDEEQMVQ